MSIYFSQGKATKEFGVTFRSKLEAQWAYALSNLASCTWDYTDSPWNDFEIHTIWGGHFKLEIKPIGERFFQDAVFRIPDEETLFVAQGEPKSSGDPWGIIDTSHPVSCVRRRGVGFFVVTSRVFNTSDLFEMFHATRSGRFKSEWTTRERLEFHNEQGR